MGEILVALAALPFVFWLLLIATLGLMAIVAESRGTLRWISGFAALGGIMAMFWVSGSGFSLDIWGWLKANYDSLLIAVAAYLMIGALYGIGRYIVFVHEISDKLKAWAVKTDTDLSALTVSGAKSFSFYADIPSYPIRISDHRSSIIHSMLWWIVSAPIWVLRDPVLRFFNMVYNRISGLLQSYTDKVFGNVTVVPDPEKPVVETVQKEWFAKRGIGGGPEV